MKIDMDGKFVTLESEEEWDVLVSEVRCECGHSMFAHGSPMFFNEMGQIYFITSQCLHCDCPQFKVKDA